MTFRIFSCFLLLAGSALPIEAQIDLSKKKKLTEAPRQYKLAFIISESGDTIPVVNLHQVNVSEERVFGSQKEKRQWSRLKRDVAKVYPYSKLACTKLRKYNQKMDGLSPADQKKMLRQAEKELLAEFEDDIKGMTLNQGRILIKLID